MLIEERQSTVQTNQEIAPPATEVASAPIRRIAVIESRDTFASRSPDLDASGAELVRRIVVLVFGLIQAVIVLRIVFLLLDAQTSNAIVFGILNLSQIFVAPFEGILHSNALSAGASVFDLAAVVAIVGWTVLELGVLAVLNLFRSGTAYGDLVS